jgi:pimeloyl-ACP methyl ester carboxylesterase
MASATATPNRRGVCEIYIGGAGDTRTRLVAAYADARQRKFAHEAHHDAHYFPHYASRRTLHLARRYIESGRSLVLVGHSWGGDTALRVLRALRPHSVDLLVCVDPVPKSRLNPPPAPRNADRVIHVDANPRHPNRSDQVKEIGQWFGGTLHRRLSVADARIVADLNHFAFSQMMLTPGEDGASAADHIEQIGKPKKFRAASSNWAGSGPAG